MKKEKLMYATIPITTNNNSSVNNFIDFITTDSFRYRNFLSLGE